METQIGTHIQIRSSFSGGKGAYVSKTVDTNSAKVRNANTDTFTRSLPEADYCSSDEYKKLREFGESCKKAVPMNLKWYKLESDSPEGRTKLNFEFLDDITKPMRENFSSALEKAGVPKDVTFEFDHDINAHKGTITKISDENYRESVESVINNFKLGMSFTAFASRVMNGYISSAYYPSIASNLKSCYEQDIADLFIDENGNLCGANENLQKAIEASKIGEEFSPDPHHRFPAKNIEGIVKLLISDENITPNVSHMGYDGESIYTDDGEFRFGKDFDPDLFGEEKYVMRGSISLYIGHAYDRWFKDHEKFY